MNTGIVYQNKDVLFKVLGEVYKDKSFKVYGLDLPPVKALLPVNLPEVRADERSTDNLYLLADDKTLAMMEYESQPEANALFKYGSRGFRILETYNKEDKDYNLVIAVIYTGDVKSAPDVLDRDGIRIRVRQVFLSRFDGLAIYDELRNKINNNEKLTDEDIMKLIILPLTKKAGDQEMIESAINLARQVEDEKLQVFIIAGILTAADKFIDKTYADQIKGWLRMTKVARLYEEEKIEAVNQAVNQAVSQKEIQLKNQFAKNLFSQGFDILTVMKSTGLTREELENLAED